MNAALERFDSVRVLKNVFGIYVLLQLATEKERVGSEILNFRTPNKTASKQRQHEYLLK